MKFIYICLITLFCLPVSMFGQKKLVILHTNDTHSQIEPLPATDKRYPNMGGVLNRKAIIDSIRSVEKNVLLLDAGDFLQGTPYFNLFHGRVESGAMDIMKYEVGTLGNHEFDYGLDTLHMVLKHIDYPIVNCNYDFSGTVVEGLTQPFVILKKDGVKIGIIGAGVDPEGLIQSDKYEGMKFKPIIETVNYYAKLLKSQYKCDLIIALTHIGLEDDKKLAAASSDIDVIIGGHSHTFMDKPAMIKNQKGKDILVYQVGKSASYIGKVEVNLDETK